MEHIDIAAKPKSTDKHGAAGLQKRSVDHNNGGQKTNKRNGVYYQVKDRGMKPPRRLLLRLVG